MRVFYFPDWVFAALKNQNIDRKDVIKPEVLKRTLSADDVAFVCYIQENINQVVPESITQTLQHYGFYSSDAIIDAYGDGKQYFTSTQMAIRDKIYDYKANGAPEQYFTPFQNLTVEMFDEETMVFYPIVPLKEFAGHSRNAMEQTFPNSGKAELLDRVIQQLSIYLTFTDLVMTPLMRDYLMESQQAIAA